MLCLTHLIFSLSFCNYFKVINKINFPSYFNLIISNIFIQKYSNKDIGLYNYIV